MHCPPVPSHSWWYTISRIGHTEEAGRVQYNHAFLCSSIWYSVVKPLYVLHTTDLLYSDNGFCNSERTDEGVRGIFQWNETEVNSNTSTGCFYGPPDVVVTRFCVSRNNLTAPSLENCRTIASTRFSTLQNVRH